MREISKISRGLGIGYDPIQGTSRHAECPAYFFCHLAQRLQARGVRGEGSYQYSIFRSRYHLQQTRSEEHTSELQSLMRISYAVFCLKKTNKINKLTQTI